MKKIPIAVVKFLLILVCTSSIFACKNGEENSGGLFSGGDELEPLSAEALENGLSTASESTLNFPETIQEFYKSRSYAPVWNEKKVRETFLKQLSEAKAEGLSVTDYYSTDIQELLKISGEMTGDQRINLELLLTGSFFQYASDLFYGKVDPKELYSLWGLKRKDLNLINLLNEAAEGEGMAEALNSLKPAHPVYEGLKKSLAEYDALKAKDSTAVKIPEGEAIKPGARDERTPDIARRLSNLGYVQLDSLENDSLYSENLVAAVKTFQKEKGLEPDGVIGNSTLRAMNMDNSQVYNKIRVNLERWRWYPRDLGEHYILVNIPDFKLAVVKDGDTVRTHNVIAGSKQRQTPIFTDTLEYIVINPLWNIPPTIQKEDIIPKASRNPSYLSNNNMTVTGPDGDILDPGSIDWSSPEVRNYRFSQSAGPSNPLGRVKIIYPNKYIIYLHDTPSKALFNRVDRAESSGCVRVENAIDLAAYVVENQPDWSKKEIEQQIASGETKQVKITRPIQVHHLYWTAWRGRDKTYFADDVYDLDAEVYEALTKSP